ncbi:hypothetical protein H8E88_05710 [candidate division KSB1 bacterium]|nr:hypothetical protein [candidate division KSB1 bacterium]MBL7094251.1 hypothetical protein [candidate division KSB1 bacterium]
MIWVRKNFCTKNKDSTGNTINTGVMIIYQHETQLQTFLNLLSSVTTRKKVFDVALVATLKDNNIKGIYTVNVADFKEFEFLEIRNPLNI